MLVRYQVTDDYSLWTGHFLVSIMPMMIFGPLSLIFYIYSILVEIFDFLASSLFRTNSGGHIEL